MLVNDYKVDTINDVFIDVIFKLRCSIIKVRIVNEYHKLL